MKQVLIVGTETGRLIELILTTGTNDVVTLVRTVEQALERCEADPPDLVVMSWASVGCTWADEFTARLRALPNGATLPLILISARCDVRYIMRILDLGGPMEILPSPCLMHDLLAKRNRLLGESE